jgi:electron transport complex protein RnfG
MSDSTENQIVVEQVMIDENEPSSAKLIFVLGMAGFLSGILLVGTYLWTLPMIEANKAAALQEAIFKVLPACATFETLELTANGLQTPLPTQNMAEGEKNKSTTFVYQGFAEDGSSIGYAIPGQVAGFQDIIVALFGYDPIADQIIGFEVLESKETPGLGDKIFKDARFQENFIALSTSPEIKAVKNGAKSQPFEVEAITGATISSKAVVKLLNLAISEWKAPIQEHWNNRNKENPENEN